MASAPIAGPSCTPNTAAPNAAPSTSPRRLGSTPPASHAKAPAHENELPRPWAKRAASSTSAERPKANTSPEAAIIARPASTTGLTPTRLTSQPAGSEPTSAPAA